MKLAILQSNSNWQNQKQTCDLKKKTHVSYDSTQALQIQVIPTSGYYIDFLLKLNGIQIR